MKRLILLLWILLSGCSSDAVPNNMVNTLIVGGTPVSQLPQPDTNERIRQTEIAVQNTQAAAILQQTQAAENVIRTATAVVQQTEFAIGITQTSIAIEELMIQQTYQVGQLRLDLTRRRMLNTIMGWGMFVIVVGFFALLGYLFFQYLRESMMRRRVVERREYLPVLVFDSQGRLVRGTPAPPGLPQQVVDSAFAPPRLHAGNEALTQPRNPVPATGRGQVDQSTHPQPGVPAAASWRLVAEDWQGGALPLGLASDGIVTVDPDANPHLLIAGAAGSGKTRFALRPLIAAALADGWQVVIFDTSSAELGLFQEHPNAHLQLLGADTPGEVSQHLRRTYDEIRRRVGELEAAGLQDWRDLPERPYRTLIVFDNFSTVVTHMAASPDRDRLWQYARMVTAEGQRVGIHLVLSIQDPSYTDLDLRIRRYTTPVCFRVSDVINSRVVLNTDGAEDLCPRQFIAILGEQLRYGFAFAPDDTEILRFLDDNPHPPQPSPDWLFGPTNLE